MPEILPENNPFLVHDPMALTENMEQPRGPQYLMVSQCLDLIVSVVSCQ